TAGAFPGSVLISPEEGLQINKWIGDERQVWTRCYRLSVDGRATTTFHSKCDGRGASVTVATLSTGKKIGGYTPRSWDSSSGYAYSGGTFLFSLTSTRRFDAPGDQTWTSSIYNSSSYGPTFGNG